MKIKIKELGPLRQAEYTMGDFTIICGKNNTGKTYATYAMYGFLSFWEEAYIIHVNRKKINSLLDEGTVVIDLNEYVDGASKIISHACKEYSNEFSRIFASTKKMFSNANYEILISEYEVKILDQYNKTFGSAKKNQLTIKKTGGTKLEVSLLIDREQPAITQRYNLQRLIGNAIKEIVFSNVFPHPFIASAERTGAAIFRKELDFARNRLIEQMSSMERDLNPFELLDKVYADYALPVRRNVDFTRRLEEISKYESYIAKEYSDILADFSHLIGGQYKVVRDELYYIPNQNKRLKLSMDESSSAVRSLLDIGFYLKHVAKKGDLLIIDEPELNLHPENQRKMARLFARLINVGIKVFITTHSDYIIKELNTLIMLNKNSSTIENIRKKEKYKKRELIKSSQIRVFMASKKAILIDGNIRKVKTLTFSEADIDPELGIEAESFDRTIDEMNRIQESLWFCEDDQQ
ncbi:MAG: hypothetical protein CSA81_01830 [Acidobacteria bacterium]|nr:MAG: hypothetical protein CSA81_01830 [Acidobacteriota bacterium]